MTSSTRPLFVDHIPFIVNRIKNAFLGADEFVYLMTNSSIAVSVAISFCARFEDDGDDGEDARVM